MTVERQDNKKKVKELLEAFRNFVYMLGFIAGFFTGGLAMIVSISARFSMLFPSLFVFLVILTTISGMKYGKKREEVLKEGRKES